MKEITILEVKEDYSGTVNFGYAVDIFDYMSADARATYPPGVYSLDDDEADKIFIDGKGYLYLG